jgi:hypothetical protein
MSRKLTSKCDGCGVEIVEGDEPGMPGGMMGLRRRHSSESWGSLSVATGHFPATFDLCEACTKRVVDLLELEIPKPETMLRHLGGIGDHAVPFMPGDFMAPPSGLPWMPPGKPGAGSPFGALSPEDLKALGIELPPGLMRSDDDHSYFCPSCHAMRMQPVPGKTTCPACGHAD